MSFVARLQRARDVLEQQGRLSVRALGSELECGGDELDEIVAELVEVQGVAAREGRPCSTVSRSYQMEEMPMTSTAPAVPVLPAALHRGERELPFVTFMEGLDIQLLQASVENGLWVVRTRFSPGVTLPRHKHTGEVFAVTFSGSWRYLEYPEVNTAGSYLYEPAGSIHTLHVPPTNREITDVWFAIRGANLNLDEQGNVASVWDAAYLIEVYQDLCRKAGHPRPAVIGL